VELLRGEYALAIVMPTKKDFLAIGRNDTCGDYLPIKKHTCSNKYAMPLLKEIFDALGQTKVFNTLDLRFGYH